MKLAVVYNYDYSLPLKIPPRRCCLHRSPLTLHGHQKFLSKLYLMHLALTLSSSRVFASLAIEDIYDTSAINVVCCSPKRASLDVYST